MAHDPTLFLPSAIHFRNHPDSVAGRLSRERYAEILGHLATVRDGSDDNGRRLCQPDPATPKKIEEAEGRGVQRIAGDLIESGSVRTIQACPLSEGWRLWDMFGTDDRDFRRLTPGQRERCRIARRLVPGRHLGLLTLAWETAPDDARHQRMTSEGSGSDWRDPDGYPRHDHAETSISNYVVHIDVVGIRRHGPGRSILEVRIFVNGELAGRGGRCGCSLGFGGGDLPAVARIDSDVVLTVDSVAEREAPAVELWRLGRSRIRPSKSRPR